MVDGADARPSWGARILAPLAFFTAATILVLLVQSSLSRDEASPTTTAAPATQATTGTAGTGATTPTTTGAQPVRKRFYRVKPGDTLEAIAARFDTTVVDLLELNPEIDPLALNPGQRIRVR